MLFSGTATITPSALRVTSVMGDRGRAGLGGDAGERLRSVRVGDRDLMTDPGELGDQRGAHVPGALQGRSPGTAANPIMVFSGLERDHVGRAGEEQVAERAPAALLWQISAAFPSRSTAGRNQASNQ
jgi:hypothetical protein